MDSLVTGAWLQEHLEDPQLKILDASWYLSSESRNAHAEYATRHIGDARFFDIDAIADQHTELPHMLPSANAFAQAVGLLGINNKHHVIIYDGSPMFSAPRAWWTFRIFGHDKVSVLNGGLPKWIAEGRPTNNSIPYVSPERFEANFRPELVRDLASMLQTVASGDAQILDARGKGRFDGTAPEPRKGMRSGHMPGSFNLPWPKLIREDGTLEDLETLRARFEKAGLSLAADRRPIVTTCGSGVTASLLAFGLFLLGQKDVAVYDGSWSEWGKRKDTPVTQAH